MSLVIEIVSTIKPKTNYIKLKWMINKWIMDSVYGSNLCDFIHPKFQLKSQMKAHKF